MPQSPSSRSIGDAASSASRSSASPAASATPPSTSAARGTSATTPPAARARQGRPIVGEVSALPRLAARAAQHAGESAAERIARRRRAAQAELDAEALGEMDWGRVGVFGAGIAIGALIGAGAALLLAPATGFETRTRLVRRARDVGGRAADRWEDVSDDVRRKARRGARKVQRAATTSRWAVEDAWEQRRQRLD